jgi:serine protease Do
MRLKGTKVWIAAVALGAAGMLPALPAPAQEPPGPLDLARRLNEAFVQVSEDVSRAVVVIKVAHRQDYVDPEDAENPFWDLVPEPWRRHMEEQREKQRQEEKQDRDRGREPSYDGQGSGVVIREEGDILTNRHVVEGAEKIKVRLKDDPTWYEAEVRGVDAQSDVAVIRLTNLKGRKLYAARLGNSDQVRVGEFAIAIGAPFELDYSVTFGHISAKGRSAILNDPRMDQDFLQTDANINPGNSGGPLVNIAGEVIGINTLIRGMRTGIGFAIPINLAREVAEKLISEGRYVRSWLGVGIRAVKDYPEFRETSPSAPEGVVITLIQPKGPAAKADLKGGDVITAVDGKPVSTVQQLRNEVRAKQIGQSVTLDIQRSGKGLKVKIKPEAWPDDTVAAAPKPAPPPTDEDSARDFGLTVKAVTAELARRYALDKAEGLVITEVEPGSIADRRGLRPGDVITEVNRKPVTSLKQFRDALQAASAKKGVQLNFISRGTSKFEVLKESGD